MVKWPWSRKNKNDPQDPKEPDLANRFSIADSVTVTIIPGREVNSGNPPIARLDFHGNPESIDYIYGRSINKMHELGRKFEFHTDPGRKNPREVTISYPRTLDNVLTIDDIRSVFKDMQRDFPDSGMLYTAMTAIEADMNVRNRKAQDQIAAREVAPYLYAVLDYCRQNSIDLSREHKEGITKALLDAHQQQRKPGGRG